MSTGASPSSLDPMMLSHRSFRLIVDLSLGVKRILGILKLTLLSIAALSYFMYRATQAALSTPDHSFAQSESHGPATTTP